MDWDAPEKPRKSKRPVRLKLQRGKTKEDYAKVEKPRGRGRIRLSQEGKESTKERGKTQTYGKKKER